MPPKKRTRKSALPAPSAKSGSAEQVNDKVDVPRKNAKPTAKPKVGCYWDNNQPQSTVDTKILQRGKDEIAPVVPRPHLEDKQETSPFHKLSAELRNEIYRLTFQGACVHVEVTGRIDSGDDRWVPERIQGRTYFSPRTKGFSAQLFRVSKQVYAEALPIAMAATSFVVHDEILGVKEQNDPRCQPLYGFLHLLGSSRSQCITNLSHDSRSSYGDAFARAQVTEKLRQCQRLRSLTFSFSRNWTIDGSQKVLDAIKDLDTLAVHVAFRLDQYNATFTEIKKTLPILCCPNLRSFEVSNVHINHDNIFHDVDDFVKMMRPWKHILQFRLGTYQPLTHFPTSMTEHYLAVRIIWQTINVNCGKYAKFMIPQQPGDGTAMYSWCFTREDVERACGGSSSLEAVHTLF